MKRYLLLLMASFTLTVVQGQTSAYSIAGAAGAIYVDIIPDTLLYPQPQSHIPYYIDINQDGTDDILIDAIFYTGGAYYDFRIDVSSLNTSTSFIRGGYQDTTWWGSPPDSFTISNSVTLKIFNYGDTIQNGIYSSSGRLARGYDYHPPIPPGQYWSTRSMLWINKGDKFFGVKYQTAADTSYGWVKVNVTGFNVVSIKEFSLSTPVAGVDSPDDINNSIVIFQNPFSSLTTLQTGNFLKNASLTVYNSIGQTVRQMDNLSGQTIVLHRDNLPSGLYFIRLTQGNETMATDKLVITDK